MHGSQGSARSEAERLVATVLAMASGAGFGSSRGSAGTHGEAASGGWSTGTAECCVCPICKVIAGLRDPSPQTAERLATGAGDFAAGVASLLRAFSAATTAGSAAPADSGQTPAQRPAPEADPWSAATTNHGAGTGDEARPDGVA